jgi:hypothetical protein
MTRDVKIPQVDRRNKQLRRLVHLVREVADSRCESGAELTFEERSDVIFGVVRDVLWLDEDVRLRELVSTGEDVEVGDVRYRRLQPSSGEYHGCWGSHLIEEPLYRRIGEHNGPTVKPVELRAGVIHGMLPDLARMVGHLSAELTSRQLVATMGALRMRPPSRACAEKRSKAMADEIADHVEELEEAVRASEPMPAGVATISTGMDRGAVRKLEVLDEASAPPRRRREPYERTPPPPFELRYRMAWDGSVTLYDGEGKPLRTLRYAADPATDPTKMARRISADVAWIVTQSSGTIDVHCIQDAAPELRVLPEVLQSALPANTNMRLTDLVDFEHLMGYIEDVVDACEPGDPDNMKSWYRSELLRDDASIDRIYRKFRDLSRSLPPGARRKRKAVAAALSYIRTRRDRMRYASFYKQGLPIGSGDTENTVWLMQQRTKRGGQSWQSGLHGILVLRGLVLSGRWEHAWPVYAATHRAEVRSAA